MGLGTLAIAAGVPLAMAVPSSAVASSGSAHSHLNCASNSRFCTEVWDSEAVFGEDVYVGHDEPATLFYSDTPGAGNQMRYQLILPKDPPPTTPTAAGKSYNFELHPAFWFGMAMCDTQSYPEQTFSCTPDSDSNIVDPAVSPKHPGTAFMEMQFYPPGWAPWPAGVSCDPTQWCAALNIDSLSENPVNGKLLNSNCASRVGYEYVNFAFITKSGHPQPNSPPNPVNATINTYTPDPSADLFMNSGDRIQVTMHDTSGGLNIALDDLTSGQSGSMTAGAANGFGQVEWAPSPDTECDNIPYNFHPMYSTSSEQTRVPWAAHTYNISFSDEIGHFDWCTSVQGRFGGGQCVGKEGPVNQRENHDGDDIQCFQKRDSLLVQVAGCYDGPAINQGFDGASYQADWPDGNNNLHPTPIQFSSPTTGSSYSTQYSRFGFEADLPRIELAPCDRFTGSGCQLIPWTDDKNLAGTGPEPAIFYPFFSTTSVGGSCMWQIGSHIPGDTNEFGQNQQYGTLYNVTYTGAGGSPTTRYNDFRQIFSTNPCPQS